MTQYESARKGMVTAEMRRIALRECGRPGPLGDPKAFSSFIPNNKNGESLGHPYFVAEFTYQLGATWFYSLPKDDNLCKSAESIYKDYVGAVKYGNIFSLDVGPNYEGKLREIDVETLQKVGQMIRNNEITE